ALREVAGRTRPLTLARDRCLPVLPALAPLLPEAGLRRGSTVAVTGSVTLAMALLAGPSAAGSWGAVVGLPSLGAEAAAALGVAGGRWRGVGGGHGRLVARQVGVVARGRRAAARERRARLWLPGPNGEVEPVDDDVVLAGLVATG